LRIKFFESKYQENKSEKIKNLNKELGAKIGIKRKKRGLKNAAMIGRTRHTYCRSPTVVFL